MPTISKSKGFKKMFKVVFISEKTNSEGFRIKQTFDTKHDAIQAASEILFNRYKKKSLDKAELFSHFKIITVD